ncbi:MAG: arylsulfatase A-like enzyme [Verrucomicrobiales bacterium]|jgi:arylsulfatase A-like enzyme
MKKLLSLFFLISAAAGLAADRPNIVLMMVDDLGYSDFGCYGSEIETPNIDALAANGLRFRNFYNTAKCHSSRVSLLTGLYCNQAGSESLSRGVTIAEVLEKAGYSTAMVGKWHLQKEPTDRGFQKYFGHLSGATNFFTGDDTFRLNGEKWDDFDEDFYTTDANITRAKQFVGEALEESPDKPFFLYVAHNAPHYPLHVREEDFRKYEGRYDVGWDAIREARQKRQLEIGLIPDSWTPAARPDLVPAWKTLSDEEKNGDSRRMAAFAGMVDRVDQVTGELVAYLKEKGVYENTLIMLCSDNGACPFDRTRGAELEPWDPKSYWCYDTGWSHVGNTPFRLHKQNQHQGGISSPMIAHWPAGLKTEPGEITTQAAHLVDFMATCIDVAETEYPEAWPGIELEPLVGKSLDPIFKGEEREPHDFLYFQFSTNRAILKGDWKLVTHRASSWELFKIHEDGTEMHDLAAQHPEVVKDLSKLWRETAENVDRVKANQSAPVSGAKPPKLKKGGTPEGGGGGKKKGKNQKN